MNRYAGYHVLHGRFDPNGTDTYVQNRQLNPDSVDVLEPREHPITHTFVFTTKQVLGMEALEHTYSWGNTYDEDKNAIWHKDAPEDVSAAREALRQRDAYRNAPWYAKPFLPDNWGKRVGGELLDMKVEEQYDERINNPHHPSYHGWKLRNNCKHEADDLIEDAQKALEEFVEKLNSGAVDFERG